MHQWTVACVLRWTDTYRLLGKMVRMPCTLEKQLQMSCVARWYIHSSSPTAMQETMPPDQITHDHAGSWSNTIACHCIAACTVPEHTTQHGNKPRAHRSAQQPLPGVRPYNTAHRSNGRLCSLRDRGSSRAGQGRLTGCPLDSLEQGLLWWTPHTRLTP